MRMIPTNSSNLTGILYDPGHIKFYVCFRNEDIYEYDGGQDATDILTNILFAKSQGKALREEVKYIPYRKLTPLEAEEVMHNAET